MQLAIAINVITRNMIYSKWVHKGSLTIKKLETLPTHSSGMQSTRTIPGSKQSQLLVLLYITTGSANQ